MACTIISPKPANCADNETALNVDSSTIIAVSVVPKWLDNGAGMSFSGTCRLIDDAGNTQIDGHGQEITTALNHSSDHNEVDTLGVDTIAQQISFALIGQPLTTRVVDGETVPLIPFSDDALANANIQKAKTVAAMSNPNTINIGDVLGL